MTPLALASSHGTLRRALATADAEGRVFKLLRKQTLYVRRDVLNADEIIAWAKQHFTTTLPADDMHVTCAFSKTLVDWERMGAVEHTLSVRGGKRVLQMLGDDAAVLRFESADLSARWRDLRERGCSWDYDAYHPHITITYGVEDPAPLKTIEPYAGPIELGPEVFAEVEESWAEDVVELALARQYAQHDYAATAARLDALEAKSLDAMRDALTESRDAFVNKIRKSTDFATLANDLKRLPRFGAVQMEVRAMLDRAWESGSRDAISEVREGKRVFAFDPNQPRAPAGTGKFTILELPLDEVGCCLHLHENVVLHTQRDYAGTDSSFSPKAATRWLRATAFWVSGILGDRVLSDVKGIILNGLKTGTAGSVMAEQIFDAFLPWLGDPDVIRDEQQLAPYRLETIVRTNTTTAYNHGRLTEFLDPEIIRFVKGIRWSSILDERTTPVCQLLDGLVFKPSDPNLEQLLPPRHYNCRSIIVPIVAGEQVREDEFITPAQIGKARELADAKFLTQTPEAWKAYSEREDEVQVVSVPDPEQARIAAKAVAQAEEERARTADAQRAAAAAGVGQEAATARADAAVAALRAMSERKIEVTVQAPAALPPADLEIENLVTGAKFRVARKGNPKRKLDQ